MGFAGKAIVKMLMSRGITKDFASKVAYSGKGWWREKGAEFPYSRLKLFIAIIVLNAIL